MERTLLATKLRIPPAAKHIVQRLRLLDVLQVEVPQHKLTVLAAPAGYGKTTLLAEWARGSSVPVVWLSLIEDDNTLEGFLRYLVTGWQHLWPQMGDSALRLLLDNLPPTLHFVLATRALPPLPLARYRARQELLEMRTSDLRFLPDETENY